VLIVWAVDSQKGQYGADPRSQHHRTPGSTNLMWSKLGAMSLGLRI